MTIHVFKDHEALSLAAAEWIIDLIRQKIKSQEQFCWLLSGGNTPKQLYSLLATEPYRNKIDWSKLHIFFGDERVVPFEDERNNGRMAQESLLSQVPVPTEQIHFIPTNIEPALSALKYEKLLHHYFDNRPATFDLSLLGMGDNGHVLSLFPGSALVHENEKAVVSLFLPSQQMHRITLTTVMVNASACIAFLVTGATKASVLKQVLKGNFQPDKYPSQLIQPLNGELHWFVDEAAASEL